MIPAEPKSNEPTSSPYDQVASLPEVERSIGRLVMSLSMIQSILEFGLWNTLGINHHDGRKITGGYTFSQLTKLFYKIVSEKNPNSGELAPLQKVIHELQDINRKRNHVVHSVWIPLVKGPLLLQMKGPVTTQTAPTSKDVDSLVQQAERALAELMNCLRKISPSK